MDTNPILTILEKVEGMISECRTSGRRTKIEVTQQMKVDGSDNYARQGDINVNILEQTILIGLYDIRDELRKISNDPTSLFSNTLNLKDIKEIAINKALKATNGSKVDASGLLGISHRTLRAPWRKEISQDFSDGKANL